MTEGDVNDFDGTLDDRDDVDNDRDPFRQESMTDFTETSGAASTRMTDVVQRRYRSSPRDKAHES